MGRARAPLAVLATMTTVGIISLVLQISLTRVLSVTGSYHAAFAVIALVMLGLAASATSVFVRSASDRPPTLAEASRKLQACAVLLCAGTVGYVWMDVVPWGPAALPVHLLAAGGLFFAGFWLTGWVVAFLLSRYHEDVGRVYWSDLTGAALGCLLTVPLLDNTSAMNVVLLCGTMSAVAGVLLARVSGEPVERAAAVLAGVALLTAAAVVWPPLTELRVAKGQPQHDNLWVDWNHLARVNVTSRVPQRDRAVALLRASDPTIDAEGTIDRWNLGWGMSGNYVGEIPPTMWVQLDAEAGTQIVEQGPSRVGRSLQYLEADVTSAAHHVLRGRLDNAFVIGGGGGRDILCALHFGADQVVVAELNPSVVEAVDGAFADFSGRPYSLPQVRLELGEARSTLTRIDERFDLLQMSMIDTWASSMAGAMVLSENSLYTLEAFELYLDRLEPDGIATVSRWYHPADFGETARVVVLMEQALRSTGVEHPEDHVAVVVAETARALQVATLLMKRTPFTEAELDALRAWADEMDFRVLHPGPGVPGALDIEALLTRGPDALGATAFDLAAPTDDRPFFFNTRLPVRSWIEAVRTGDRSLGSPSSLILGMLILLLLVISRLIVWDPLARHEASKPEGERMRVADHLAPLVYFGGIGLGFMWIELAIIQRYIVFLGHPTYALSVVLFALLLFGAIGSAVSERFGPGAWKGAVGATVAGALLTAFVVPAITDAALHLPTPGRIALALALVAPMGFVMGMMYPTGVRMLSRDGVPELGPWVWAINGIAGVLASTIGMFLAMSFGYTAVLLLGIAAYGATALAASRSFRVAARP